MKTHTARTIQVDTSNTPPERSVDQKGQKVSPPAYGLDFADQQLSPIQAVADARQQSARNTPLNPQPNNTGLPDKLKTGVENLSGYSMDDVKVHYNSSKPTQVNALAYAQGTDIHLGPGQEKHLPHEAWHVVQQKEGRVRPTARINGGENINDNANLETEADAMGKKVMLEDLTTPKNLASDYNQSTGIKVIQRLIWYEHSIPQFQVDGKKPSFIGSVKAMVLLASQSRDHIVPYAAIENDLAVLLNDWLNGSRPLTDIQDFTETLFPTKGFNKSYIDMRKARTNLFKTLNSGTFADYEKHARALLSRLNSSTDNIRIGDSSINSSIGENLDTDFLPGVQTVSPFPPTGLQVQGASGVFYVAPGTQYLQLEPASEAVLWEYQNKTTQDLSFVLDSATNTQLSSVDAPTPFSGFSPSSVAGKPVIVFHPTNAGLPFYYD